MFGRLTLDSIPYHDPIIVTTLTMVALVGMAVVFAITKAGKWQYLWNEWFISVDHKKLGFMYSRSARVTVSCQTWRHACGCAERLDQHLSYIGKRGGTNGTAPF